jgi:hypothetical protein
MNRQCFMFSKLMPYPGKNSISEKENIKWQEHLRSCSECREQLIIHKKLTGTLTQAPSVRLSDNFDNLLFKELHKDSQTKPVRKTVILLEIGYWSLAVLLSVMILWKIELLSRNIFIDLLPYLTLIGVPLSFIVSLFYKKIIRGLFRLTVPIFQ